MTNHIYTIILHEDLGGDRSVVGRELGHHFAESLPEAAEKITKLGAADVGGWVARTDLDKHLDTLNPFYCGAQEVDGVYTRFDIQRDEAA